MSKNGINKFLEYLDSLNEMIVLFKGLELSSEVMEELPLSEEQIEVANAYLNGIQEDWSDGFVKLLKIGMTWLEENKEVKE